VARRLNRSLHRNGIDFPSRYGRDFEKALKSSVRRSCSPARIRSAAATFAFISSNATVRGRYFMPQSGAKMRHSDLTYGSARRIRSATISGVSIS
jgi:hypothetical protein